MFVFHSPTIAITAAAAHVEFKLISGREEAFAPGSGHIDKFTLTVQLGLRQTVRCTSQQIGVAMDGRAPDSRSGVVKRGWTGQATGQWSQR